MASLTFVLKDPKSEKESIIFLLFFFQNERLKYSTNEKILPEFWDKTTQRAKISKKFPEYRDFNAKLDNISYRAKNAFRKFEYEKERLPTKAELKEILDREFGKNQAAETKGLFSFIEKFIEQAILRVNPKTGKTISSATIHVYQITLRVLKEFTKQAKFKVDFDTIDLDFYHAFVKFLTKEKKFSNNTVGKHVKTLKVFLSDANENGLAINQSFKSKKFRTITEKTDSIYLTEEELGEMERLDLSFNPKLDRARDLFLIGCWTGLRFSDFSSITRDQINGDFIEIETQKTGETVVIPIHNVVKNIIEKYKDEKGYHWPELFSNATMNARLKEIGEKIESLHQTTQVSFTKGGVYTTNQYKKYELLTTHTARRSFATNLFKDGVPTLTIMKITGHRTEKAFLRYIKVTPNENALLLQKHWSKKI